MNKMGERALGSHENRLCSVESVLGSLFLSISPEVPYTAAFAKLSYPSEYHERLETLRRRSPSII